MTDILYFTLLSVAAARIAVLVVHDKITEPWRTKLFLRWPPEDNASTGHLFQSMDAEGRLLPAGARRDWHMATELLTCTRCVTVWTVGALWLLGELAGRPNVIGVYFGIAGMALASWVAARL